MNRKFSLVYLLMYQSLVWFILCLSLRLVFVFSFVVEKSFLNILKACIYGLRLDSAFLGYILILTILLTAFNRKVIYKINQGIFVFLLLFQIVISIIDMGLFKVWGHTINFQFFEYLKHPLTAVGNAASTSLLLPLIIFAFGLVFTFTFGIKLFPKFSLRKKHLLYFAQFLFFLPIAFISARGGLQVAPINQSFAYFSAHAPLNYAALNSSWNIFFNFIEKENNLNIDEYSLVSESKIELIFNQEFPNDSQYLSISNLAQPNVVIVMLESFTANIVGACNIGQTSYTPSFDIIAKEGLFFPNMYASGNRTDKGLAAVLSGFPSQSATSVITIPEKAKKLPSLANYFKEQGYQTFFAYGGEPEFANMKAYLLSTGFDAVWNSFEYPRNINRGKWGVADEFLYHRLAKTISVKQQPFFVTALTLSSHEPFDYPNAIDPKAEDAFKRSIQYADKCLGFFFNEVKNLPNYQNTLYIFLADHGRNIGNPLLDNYPLVSRIPIIITGGALNNELKGKVLNQNIMQHHLPSNLLNGLANPQKMQNFKFQNSWISEKSDIYYTYFDGVGLFNSQKGAVYDNKQKKSMNVSNLIYNDSQLYRARIYQQAVMQTFFELDKN